ncbi:MAG TPA: flagellar basal body L-ring protein FlgH [Gemmatimonadales bacterium]|nr:flagellar basal body L-ring protein FlgH [Gemmatimonadales bacterium]
MMRRYLFLFGLASPLAAQGAPPSPAQTQAPANAAPPANTAAAPAMSRAGWFSDKRPLRIGDLLTIQVDEAVNATESLNQNGTSQREQDMALNANVITGPLGPQKGFSSSLNSMSQDGGQAGRQGDLTATISVRVQSIEPTGLVHVKGQKTISVDGRNQVIELEGVVRPEDVDASNTVSSSRLAESVISYKGKKIGPAKGILGKLLSIFWP